MYNIRPAISRKRQQNDMYVAKIYDSTPKETKSQDPSEKLRFLIEYWKKNGKKLRGFSFPRFIVTDEKKQCVGFLMPRYTGYSLEKIFGCFQDQRRSSMLKRPPFLRDITSKWTRVELTSLAIDILQKLERLHQWGFLMGDINTSNILVSEDGGTLFIDVDSYQIERFTCSMFRPEFISPRLEQMGNRTDVFYTTEDENYAIAVLIFQILFVGTHPYARSGKDTIDHQIMQRNFAYPLTYKRAHGIPSGPWQKIWYCLPFNIQKAFQIVFNGSDSKRYPDTSEWIRLLCKYKADLEANAIRRDIFPTTDSVLNQEETFLGEDNDDTEPSSHPELREFETTLANGNPSQKTVYIEFGSTCIRSFNKSGERWKCMSFMTRHFSLIDRNGRMDTKRLANNTALINIAKSVANIQPEVSHVRAFGGSCLRHLANRTEVIRTLQQVTGFHFGILSRDEETSMLAEMAITMEPSLERQTMLIIDVGGLSTNLIYRTPEGQITRTTMPRLGSQTLRNWVFSTHPGDNRPTEVLSQHDAFVSEEITRALPDMKPTVIVGIGALVSMIPYGEIKVDLDDKQLKERTFDLTESLSLNRDNISDFHKSIRSHNKGASFDTSLRLALPIYISIMHQLGISQLKALRFGLGKAYINHHTNSFNNE